VPGSDPFAEAEGSDVYAVENRGAEPFQLRGLVQRALDHLRLREDNAHLRRQSDQNTAMVSALRAIHAGAGQGDVLAVRHLPGALLHVDDASSLLQGLAEDVARTLRVSRVGIFYRQHDIDVYRLHAATCCLEGTRDLTYTPRDPLVRWLLQNAHVVTRENLEREPDTDARNLLRNILERLGAEILVPLQSRERLHGWVFLGHRTTGLPFEPAHMENLAMVAEHIATALENASLYGEVAVQKTLAETLLQTMPVGIVAVDVQGFVRGFNPPAVALLNQPAEEVMRRPVDQLDSRVADALRGALAGNADGEPREWTSTLGHQLEVRVRRLMNEGACLGAMLMLRDVTVERQLGERQSNLERATFWNELAAAMAHEIRNPLVAIRTFAQLLPERYQEVEFRNEFHTLVTSEVDRLNGIVEQINGFAHPPAMEFKRLDPVPLLRRAADALGLGGEGAAIKLVWRLESGLLQVWGDERALADTFAHLLRNACEALQGKPPASGGVITVHARRKGRAMLVTIGDNGPGIDPSVRDRCAKQAWQNLQTERCLSHELTVA